MTFPNMINALVDLLHHLFCQSSTLFVFLVLIHRFSAAKEPTPVDFDPEICSSQRRVLFLGKHFPMQAQENRDRE